MKTALLFTVISIASCTEGMCNSTESANSDPIEHVVEITGFAFVPDNLQVKAGDTITWVNRDIVPHTATGQNNDWDTGTLLQNESRTISVSSAMSTDYFCRFHLNMTATVSLGEIGDSTNSTENSTESQTRTSSEN